MGDNKSSSYTDYKNFRFEENDILHISGDLKIKVSTDTALEPEEEYDNKAKKEVTFSEGVFSGGKDIEAGVYDLYLAEGASHVKVANDLDEDIAKDTSGTSDNILHVYVQDGDKIEITGAKIRFEPAKIGLEKNLKE